MSGPEAHELLTSNLAAVIERAVAFAARRHQLGPSDAEELGAIVKLRLVENDYAILRAYEQRSSFATYISIVVQRMALDYRLHTWGKWHCSAEAQRLGPLAVDLFEGGVTVAPMARALGLDQKLTYRRIERRMRGIRDELPRYEIAPRHVFDLNWAFIAFRESDFISSSGWSRVSLGSAPGSQYVRLNGEHVQFVGTTLGVPPPNHDARARLQSIPAVPAVVFSQQNLGLEHLQECCKDPRLRPEYMGPDFRLASGVFDLSNGHATACAANEAGVHGRIDTVVSVDNDGVLLIAATKNNQKKELRLKGSAHLLIGNLPTDFFVIGGKPSLHSTSHHAAYGAMIDPANVCVKRAPCTASGVSPVSCAATPLLGAGLGVRHQGVPAGTARELTTTATANANVRREGVLGATASTETPNSGPPMSPETYSRFDAQCSNTQWP